MIKRLKQLQMNNAGSTMVEVLVGFTILVIILVECMVHIVGVSSNMIEKSKDMDNDIRTLNASMYEANADYEEIHGVTFTLVLDNDKTNVANKAMNVELGLDHAIVSRFDCISADLSVYKVQYKED